MMDRIFINGDVFKDGKISPVNVGVKDGRIVYVGEDKPQANEVIDCHGLTILPGIIDTNSL